MGKEYTVMLVAGEASGDQHAARLARDLVARNPQVRVLGMGAEQMRQAGVELLVDSTRLAVVGLVEVLAHYPEIKSALKTLQRRLLKDPPDLLILVDYPDFNLRLAATAREAGVKVLYYISPQVWAWRAGRVRTIARLVDMMAVVFPFEVSIYERAGVPVRFTGHPLVDEVHPTRSRDESLSRYGLVGTRPVVGLMPGSRLGEIRRLLPVVLDTARVLLRSFPDMQFILPVAPGLTRSALDDIEEPGHLPVTYVEDDTIDAIAACDAVATASGTATLVVALLGVPMAVFYRISPLTFLAARALVKVRQIGIINIVSGRNIVREFIQHQVKPDDIAAEIGRILTDGEYAQRIRADLAALPGLLRPREQDVDIAELADQMLQGNVDGKG